jgi:hypothetical protein
MAYGLHVYEMLTLTAETGRQMIGFGMSRCRTAALLGVVVAMSLVAGCSTVTRTLDFSSDPELQRKGSYPNINESGPKQPGKLMTPEELDAAKKALAAKAAASSPAVGAAAKAEGASSAQELQALAKTHGQQTLEEIKAECAKGTAPDATKCPQ